MKRTPQGMTHAEAARAVQPRLILRLAEGWRLDPDKGVLAPDKQIAGNPFPTLPSGSQLIPLLPGTTSRSRRQTRDERDLAAMVQLLLPIGTDARIWAKQLGDSAAVESVQLAPTAALPEI